MEAVFLEVLVILDALEVLVTLEILETSYARLHTPKHEQNRMITTP